MAKKVCPSVVHVRVRPCRPQTGSSKFLPSGYTWFYVLPKGFTQGFYPENERERERERNLLTHSGMRLASGILPPAESDVTAVSEAPSPILRPFLHRST